MKKLVLILGNGLTMDLLSNLDEKKNNIDLSNLFSKGDTVVWPDGNHERGFLSLPLEPWRKAEHGASCRYGTD